MRSTTARNLLAIVVSYFVVVVAVLASAPPSSPQNAYLLSYDHGPDPYIGKVDLSSGTLTPVYNFTQCYGNRFAICSFFWYKGDANMNMIHTVFQFSMMFAPNQNIAPVVCSTDVSSLETNCVSVSLKVNETLLFFTYDTYSNRLVTITTSRDNMTSPISVVTFYYFDPLSGDKEFIANQSVVYGSVRSLTSDGQGRIYLFGEVSSKENYYSLVIVLNQETTTISVISAELLGHNSYLTWSTFNEVLSNQNGFATFTGTVVTGDLTNSSVVQIGVTINDVVSIQNWTPIDATINSFDVFGSPYTDLSSDYYLYALGAGMPPASIYQISVETGDPIVETTFDVPSSSFSVGGLIVF